MINAFYKENRKIFVERRYLPRFFTRIRNALITLQKRAEDQKYSIFKTKLLHQRRSYQAFGIFSCFIEWNVIATDNFCKRNRIERGISTG